MAEQSEPTSEQLAAMLRNEEFLASEGFRITPKGHMSLVLLDLGVSRDAAASIAQKMEDRIFKAGWIYVQADEIELVDPNE